MLWQQADIRSICNQIDLQSGLGLKRPGKEGQCQVLLQVCACKVSCLAALRACGRMAPDGGVHAEGLWCTQARVCPLREDYSGAEQADFHILELLGGSGACRPGNTSEGG